MISSPFALFLPFKESLHIDLCTKEDAITGDAMVADLLQDSRIASAEQIHGKESAIVREPIRRMKCVDGLMTDKEDLPLLVRVADCQSFVFFDPTVKAVGILHAGWRGLVAGAIPRFLEIWKHEWASDPHNIYVGAGPSLCQMCAEFTDPVRELPDSDPRFFDGRHADLRGIADAQLLKAGILRGHLERSNDCTQCRNDRYWSYRGGDRDAVKNGYENVLVCRVLK